MNTENEDLSAKVRELDAKLAYYSNIFNELDDKIYHLQMINNAQQNYINSHARKFKRIYETIYQICGKVFDHNTEMDYIINYMNYMMHNNHSCTHFVNHDDNESEPDLNPDSDSEQ